MQRTDQIIQLHLYDANRNDKHYYMVNTCDPDVQTDEYSDIDDDFAGLTIHYEEEYFSTNTYMTEEDEIQECLLIELECQLIANN